MTTTPPPTTPAPATPRLPSRPLARTSTRVAPDPRVPLRAFRTPVRGFPFAATPPGAPLPHAGAQARLEREPSNPADPFAVAVWMDPAAAPPWRIGYLDRGVAARLAPRLDTGAALQVRLDGWVAEPDGRWQRPLVLLVPEVTEGPGPTLEGSGSESRTRTEARSPVERIPWGRPPGVRRRVIGPAR
jgi:hypothetical protein